MRAGATLVCSLIGYLLHLPLSATIIHVPGDQPTIQAGIGAAETGDTVLVADGTYSGAGNRDIDFLGKAITVRSENGAENCFIDCEQQGGGFHFHGGEGRDSVLRGFSIRNGKTHLKGGIHIEGASPTIANNIITGCGNVFISCSGIYCSGGSPMILNNTISDNWSSNGGGLYIVNANPTILNNTISGNVSVLFAGAGRGGGIYCVSDSHPLIENSTIIGNHCSSYGGGVCSAGSLTITNCTIMGNEVTNPTGTGSGGGVANIGLGGYQGDLSISNCIIDGNSAQNRGGGIYNTTNATITNCALLDNSAYVGGGILNTGNFAVDNCTICDNTASSAAVVVDWSFFLNTITNTILWNPESYEVVGGAHLQLTYSDIRGGWPGVGNIDADPLFVTGPLGEYYLSHEVCGDTLTSPCAGTGDPSSEAFGTTGCLAAWGSADMGYRYPAMGLVVGPGPAADDPPTVRVFPPEQDAEAAFEFDAYDFQHYGVNVICGEVSSRGTDRILTGPGPGEMYGPHVCGFQVDGTPLPGLSYLGYGTKKWGVNVAAGDIDADGFDEIITGPGPGPLYGPHVRCWNFDGGPAIKAISGVSFFAYGLAKWGVNVSCGDIDGDGFDEIVTGPGPGPGYGPHVRGWNVDDGAATSMPGVSYLAYQSYKYGVNVTCGDLDGDGIDEIATGPGPCGLYGAHVRGWDYDGSSVTPMTGLNFLAWIDSERGANVHAGADLDGDGRDELIVGCGSSPGGGTPVKIYSYDRSEIALWFSLGDGTGMTLGANVAAGRF